MLKLIGLLRPSTRVGAIVCDAVAQNGNVSSLLSLSSVHKTSLHLRPASTQAKLLQMPVPPLQETLNKYLRSVKPLVTDEEYRVTENIVKKFGAANGVGEKLQKLLEERAKNKENWLTDWWLQNAYFTFRYPVVAWSSPGLIFPFQTNKTQDEQVKVAAQVILAALDYKKLIDDDKLPQERIGKDPADMSQYTKVFGTCRIPGLTEDSLLFADPKNPPRHVVVAHNNSFYEVTVYGDDAQPLSEEQVRNQLQEIVKSSGQAKALVGVLTSDNRDNWGKAYGELIKDSQNASSLTSLARSLFLVCLDGPNPNTGALNRQTVAALQMVHGCGSKSNGSNRWYDKTIQFIVGTDGELGLAYEHSPAEGPPIANLMDHIADILERGGLTHSSASKAVKPKRLDFNVSSSVQDMIHSAQGNLDSLVGDLEMACFTFKGYGKEFPKSQKLSPDSFIQMAMQLAFYRIHNKPAAHYESASTRKFMHGRTETIRSCSIESVAFAKAMLDSSKSSQEKAQAIHAAVGSHKQYAVEAVNGRGVDRHLLGLKLIGKENGIEVPALYSDVGFTRSSHMRISTSQVAGRCDSFMCYGPLVPDGYACCYNPRKMDIIMGVSAFNSCPETSALKYKEALEESFTNMHDVLVQSQLKSKL